MFLYHKLRFLVISALVVQLLCMGQDDLAADTHRHPSDSAAFVGPAREMAVAGAEATAQPISAKRVKVQAGMTVGSFETRALTVGEFLGEQGILVGPLDAVSPDLAIPIEDGLVVTIAHVDRNFEIEETPLAAGVVWQGDPNLLLDQIQTRTVGKPGLVATRTRITRRAGQPPERDLVESWTRQEALDTVFVFGQKITKSTFQPFEGHTLAYWRKTRMLATSYSAANAGTSQDAPWYGYTFSGEPMGHSVVAADLDIMPLRTQLYIPGYGYGTVLDTGGGLRGMHIDLGYEDEEYVSWHGVVDVYWLWPPPADTSEIMWILPPAPTQR